MCTLITVLQPSMYRTKIKKSDYQRSFLVLPQEEKELQMQNNLGVSSAGTRLSRADSPDNLG